MSLRNWFWVVLIILVFAACANHNPSPQTSAAPSLSASPALSVSLVPSPLSSPSQDLATKTLQACLKNDYGVSVRISPGEVGGQLGVRVSWDGYNYPDNWPETLTVVQPAVAGANWVVSDATCPASGHTWYQIIDTTGQTLGYIYGGAFN